MTRGVAEAAANARAIATATTLAIGSTEDRSFSAFFTWMAMREAFSAASAMVRSIAIMSSRELRRTLARRPVSSDMTARSDRIEVRRSACLRTWSGIGFDGVTKLLQRTIERLIRVVVDTDETEGCHRSVDDPTRVDESREGLQCLIEAAGDSGFSQ